MEPPSSMRTDISAGAPPNSDSTHTPDLTISPSSGEVTFTLVMAIS